MFVTEFTNHFFLFFFIAVVVLVQLILSNVNTKDKTGARELSFGPLDLEQHYEMLCRESCRQGDANFKMRAHARAKRLNLRVKEHPC